jgi:16S rRNA A1518/A1519 N6-dimethyltransferase RsmA/KsgA/DIM1 with predicted DNA glycosylase/AP lyase activity
LRKGSQVIDLGSGDGRVILEAAKNDFTAVGYELNPLLAVIAKYRLRKYPKAECKIGDYWLADVSRARLVFIFSAQPYMKRLSQKLNNELKPGAQVVSYGFSLPGRKITKKVGAANVYQF